MWYDGYPWGAPSEPSYKPTPQKRSTSTLSVPTGADWVRRPCYQCDSTGCKACDGKGVGWSPSRPLWEACPPENRPHSYTPGKPHPAENRWRRDENGKWFVGPLTVGDVVGDPVQQAFATSPQKRIEINIPPKPHPSGPDEYFGYGGGFYGGP